MAAAQAAKNYGDESGLSWYLRWRIYTAIQTWIHSQSTKFRDIFPWKIFQMITKTITISTSYTMKQKERKDLHSANSNEDLEYW